MSQLQENAPVIIPIGSAATRLADKLKNAYGIDLIGEANKATQPKGLSLVSLSSTETTAGQETYEEQQGGFLQRYWIAIVLALVAVLLLRR